MQIGANNVYLPDLYETDPSNEIMTNKCGTKLNFAAPCW